MVQARILIVDDDEDILKVTDKILSLVGYDVVTAKDAIQGMDRLNSAPFDLLLCDANMPHFSGFEFIQTLRNNRRFEKMAIAMITGRREERDIKKAIRCGVDGYIVKPIEPNLLVSKIEEIFKKKPPVDRNIYKLPESSNQAAAAVIMPTQIVSLSDTGITIRAGQPFEEGSLIELNTDLFRKMGMVQSPALKVLSNKKWGENIWEIQLGFYGASENLVKGVRRWIHKQNMKAAA